MISLHISILQNAYNNAFSCWTTDSLRNRLFGDNVCRRHITFLSEMSANRYILGRYSYISMCYTCFVLCDRKADWNVRRKKLLETANAFCFKLARKNPNPMCQVVQLARCLIINEKNAVCGSWSEKNLPSSKRVLKSGEWWTQHSTQGGFIHSLIQV